MIRLLSMGAVFVAFILSLGRPVAGKQIIAYFNDSVAGNAGVAQVDVNDFAGSSDRLAAPGTNARLGPPGSGFPGDGPTGRALQAGVPGAPPQFLHVPLDQTADFSQGTFEAWVKTAWDWTEKERHSFIDLRMAGEKRNGLNLCYDGRMKTGPALVLKINDGDGTGDTCLRCESRKLGWKKGEWHHLTASWTPFSSWLFAEG